MKASLQEIVIEIDHKPLQSIWKKPITSASPGLQRRSLRMAKYDVDIRYLQGKNNVIADALSRVCHMERPPNKNKVPLIELTSTLPAILKEKKYDSVQTKMLYMAT